MFDTNFSHTTDSTLPSTTNIDSALRILHDFSIVSHFSPDNRGCTRLTPPASETSSSSTDSNDELNQPVKYDVEDAISFIPKRLWNGGVHYTATFTPVADGCDILVEAPGGFTSNNMWRLVRAEGAVGGGDERNGEWVVRIKSDARCNKTFAGIVKGFVKGSHMQQQKAFKEELERGRRPGLGRRRSSWPME